MTIQVPRWDVPFTCGNIHMKNAKSEQKNAKLKLIICMFI